MRPIQVVVSVLLIFTSISFLLIFLGESNDYTEGPVTGSIRMPRSSGIIYSLKQALPNGGSYGEDDDNFIVKGFKLYRKFTPFLKKVVKRFHPKNSWILVGKTVEGNITLKNIQREQSKLQPVLILFKYYEAWLPGDGSVITVTGTLYSRDADHVEEETEILPDIASVDTPKGGYCQKIIYFGTVDEVKIEASIKNHYSAAILIDEVKIVVGPSNYDKIDDFVCNEK